MKDFAFKLFMISLGFGLVSCVVYGVFQVTRVANWHFGYQDMVKAQIEDSVRPECLNINGGVR